MQIETVIDKLIKTLHYANNNSAYYKKIFATNGISISDLTSEEFNRIPFTHKKDLSVSMRSFWQSQIPTFLTLRLHPEQQVNPFPSI